MILLLGSLSITQLLQAEVTAAIPRGQSSAHAQIGLGLLHKAPRNLCPGTAFPEPVTVLSYHSQFVCDSGIQN